MKKNKILKISLGLIAVLLIVVLVFSKTQQVSPLSWKVHHPVFIQDKHAISGYDPVAYVEDGKAVMGNTELNYEWNENLWSFSSAAHLEAFKGNPDLYIPEFGGYCSFAVSKGFTATSDPEIWHIENGKLYLFNGEEVKADWLKELDSGVIERCEKNWR